MVDCIYHLLCNIAVIPVCSFRIILMPNYLAIKINVHVYVYRNIVLTVIVVICFQTLDNQLRT